MEMIVGLLVGAVKFVFAPKFLMGVVAGLIAHKHLGGVYNRVVDLVRHAKA